MRKLIFRWIALMAVTTVLLVSCGCEKPPPDLSDANIIELIIGLVTGESRHASEPYFITTPSGAIIPAPVPGTKFTVAVGTEDVTIVQAHSGTVEVFAAGTWQTIEAGEQAVVRSGAAPSAPAPATPLDRDRYLQNPELGGG
ncbi:MAG: hypothetical protein ACE5OS_04615 [Anaerolineae bacterium]